MKKRQVIIEVNPKSYMPNLSKVNELLEDDWLVKKVIVCHENCIHYLLEKEISEEDDK